MTESEIRNLCD